MIAYLDCVGGLAGDMLLSALLDAGAPGDALREVPRRLGQDDVEVRIERVERHGIGALHLDVLAPEQHEHRGWSEIRRQLESADLDARVRAEAVRVFGRLAEAESDIHGVPPEEVEFHELGAVDTLIDIVGAITLLHRLGVQRLVCSPLPQGHGTISTAHGAIPSPAPATAALLIGAPVFGVDVEGELVTPTGAALASTLAHSWGMLPAMTPTAIGYGAGTKDWPQRANILRVVLGHGASSAGREVVVIETNLDDLLPELVPDAVSACFAAGALDVWTTPAGMKKGRPGLVLAALAPPEAEEPVVRAILRETSTLGVRVSRRQRYELERDERQVDVHGHPVRVKIGRLDGEVLNIAPEHDDCAAVALATGASVKSVWAMALAAAVERD